MCSKPQAMIQDDKDVCTNQVYYWSSTGREAERPVPMCSMFNTYKHISEESNTQEYANHPKRHVTVTVE